MAMNRFTVPAVHYLKNYPLVDLPEGTRWRAEPSDREPNSTRRDSARRRANMQL